MTHFSNLKLAIAHILLVSDNPIAQTGLVHALSDYPQLKIVGQLNQQHVDLNAVRQLNPDLIILSIEHSWKRSVALIPQLKRVQPQTRILLLTAAQSDLDLIAVLASGVDAYCTQGSSLKQLFLAIASVQDGAIYMDTGVARQLVQRLQVSAGMQPVAPVEKRALSPLSHRELEVLQLLVKGHSNPEIARLLYLSISTVKTHVQTIKMKLAVGDRVQAAVTALRLGLVV